MYQEFYFTVELRCFAKLFSHSGNEFFRALWVLSYLDVTELLDNLIVITTFICRIRQNIYKQCCYGLLKAFF